MILDQKTINKLINRDDATFEAIFHETKKSIYGLVFSIIKDHDEAKDITQDVYIKMLIKIENYKVGTNFKNWLLQIAKNHTIDIYRRNQRQVNIDDDALNIALESKASSPDKHAYILSILEQLDEEERVIVVLKVVEERTHKDIAKIVGKPLGTVLWLYQRALAKLKKLSGDMYEEK